MNKTFASLALILLALSHLSGQPGDRAREIIKKVDQLYRSASSYARMEMEISTPHWQRTLSLEAWSKGTDKTFILINSPKKESGTATLRLKNEMWNYLPQTAKVIKVPPSMMMGSWMGSDFNNDDLVRESSMLDDYTYKMIAPAEPEPGTLSLEMIPHDNSPVVWGKIILTVREKDYLPVREEYYDEKGKMMRLMEFKEIKVMGGKTIPTVMELIPQNKEGSRTVIRYLKTDFDIPLKDDIFSLRNLKKGR
ncbi:MAG: outer membrane lipoprotein-sorting protein [Candidatus Edwardsbacteria bacterium]|nr:outer membrane lipoprotein-sorting protein [Candidatus Edwardsbacteria bacterium]